MIDYKHQKAAGFPIDASELYLGEMRWIAEHAALRGGDVVFAAAVGDVWQHQSLPIDAEAIPLPSDETTPPVTKTNFVWREASGTRNSGRRV